MRYPRIAAIVFCAQAACLAQAESDGRTWTIENSLIRVRIEPQTGTFSVLDKRIGHTWASAPAKQVLTPEVAVPQAAAAPKIDADLADWPPAAKPIAISHKMTGDAAKIAGAKDLSATVRLCWHADALCIAATVRDEKLLFPKPNEGTWWKWDSVEFWIGDVQCAMRLSDTKVTFWSKRSTGPGFAAKVKRTADGYVLEARVPIAKLVGNPRPGKRYRFALGVNDADANGGQREGQIYFPATWRHSSPGTFATLILAGPDGKVPSAKPAAAKPKLRDLQKLTDGRMGFCCTADCDTGRGKSVEARLTLSVPKGAAQLRVEVDMVDRKAKTPEFRVLPPLPSATDDGVLLFCPYNDGLAIPVSLTSWRRRRFGMWGDQPWVGLLDGAKGYAIIAETPHDMMARLQLVEQTGRRSLAPQLGCCSSKGEFRYPRRLRYCFVHTGGIVAVAKQYRSFAKETGLLRTLKEKMKTKPELAKLAGAPDVWRNLGLKWCREAKAAGMDRALVNGPSSAEHMEAIKALGYLISVYDNYEDCIAEGKPSRYTDVKIPDDCPLMANGKRQKGWLTFDKKKQFMKRCSIKQLEVAKRWIPQDLEKHPYNARFIDVTTATGLRECYDPNHPCTREEDCKAKRALARYMGDELGLVLGGEHGRFWGADIYDYWEGMQSGGFYSWPAGHVGKALPEKREDIGQSYLDYGLGHRVRVPLWELVFGDCVVCTWYWGDSTGHLYNVAPELAAKKDAFNILYATVPLYWNDRPFGLNWSKPELCARLLESYRNTCKLHEVIGFEEMVDFAYVTPDKDVQRTRFADGTVVTVNFGDKPFTLKSAGKEYRLPRFGFFVKGPRIFQYKAIVDGRPVTEIRKANYIFGDGGGKAQDFGAVRTDGRVTLRQRPQGLIINVEQAKAPVVLRLAQCVDDWRDEYVRLLALDKVADVRSDLPMDKKGDVLTLRGDGIYRLVYGASGAKPDLRLEPDAMRVDPSQPKQGGRVTVTVKVRNPGGPAKRAKIALYLDDVTDASRVGITTIDVGHKQVQAPAFTLDTKDLDGPHTLIAVADPDNALDEIAENDNRLEHVVAITPDWQRWPHRVALAVTTNAAVSDWPVSAAVDLSGALGAAGLDLASVRVAEVDAKARLSVPVLCQWEPADAGKGTIWWVMPGETKPSAPRQFMLLFAGKEHGRFRTRTSTWWNAETKEVTTPAYRVGFVDGAIRSLYLRHTGAPTGSVLRSLVTSSGETGWQERQGEVTRMETPQTGPVRCVVEVDKNLPKGYRYTKRYEFFARHFVVTTQINKHLCYTRAFYSVYGEYLDDKGHRASVDGKGDAEGIAGKNPNPQWYQFAGGNWAHSCVALTAFSNISYWDGVGQIGFTGAKTLPCQVGYMLHPAAPAERFGDADAAVLKANITVRVGPATKRK